MLLKNSFDDIASPAAIAVARDMFLGCLLHTYVQSILMNAVSQESLVWISSNLAKTFTWTQSMNWSDFGGHCHLTSVPFLWIWLVGGDIQPWSGSSSYQFPWTVLINQPYPLNYDGKIQNSQVKCVATFVYLLSYLEFSYIMWKDTQAFRLTCAFCHRFKLILNETS